MSTWIDPETHIEHDQDKRAADMTDEKDMVNKAYSKMKVCRDAYQGYNSSICDGAPLDAEKLADYEQRARKAATDFEVIWACCSTRAARIDFINAALNAGKTDREIYEMLVPAVECRTQDGTTAIFKALVVALGGTMTDLNVN